MAIAAGGVCFKPAAATGIVAAIGDQVDRLLSVQTIVKLYHEARRRKVFRTAFWYAATAWLGLQIADVMFLRLGIPDEAVVALFWAAVLGFPVALGFGWLFEVGPGGIRRTSPRDASDLAKPAPLARRDYLLLAVFALIAVAVAWRAVQEVRETPTGLEVAAGAEATAELTRLANSIAVLPFANVSSDPENEYFCDGISEEILNRLSEVRQLTVIGRTSSFAFKGSDTGIERISAVLGVGYVLQGSVRKAGDELRISAQLIDERGRQLWTQTFDRRLESVFDIQDEIAQAVATTVAEQVIASPQGLRHPNLEAYDHFLAGRELLHRRDVELALVELGRAIELDPDFSDAHAEWAIARTMGNPTKLALKAAVASIDRALNLKPQLLRAQAARGFWLLQSLPPDVTAAEAALRRVLEQDPNMSDALLWLSNALGMQGRADESLEILRRANRIDPLHPSIAVNLATALRERGESEAALQMIRRVLQQPIVGWTIFVWLLDMHQRRGELIEANAVAKDVALRGAPQHWSLALSYALLGDLNKADYWLERSLRDYPEWPWNPYFPVNVPSWRGDSGLALQRFEQGMRSAGVRIEDQAQIIRIWHGSLLARSGHYAAAIDALEPLADVATTPESLEVGFAPEHDGWRALAWAYQHTGAEARAARILSELRDQCRLQLGSDRGSADSDLLHYCAETALMAGDVDEALALLEQAVAAGWRDYYLRQNDPYWSSLEDDPRYRDLMATVKADVDRQRAEVERIDATDDFMARLDAHLAARRAAAR